MMLATLGAFVQGLIDAFKARVLAFPGIFEAEACLKTQLDAINDIGLLQDATIVITPNGVNENILHTVKGNTITAFPYNLMTYTENLLLWSLNASTRSTVSSLDPFGVAKDIVLMSETTANASHRYNSQATTILSSGVVYTGSVFLKKGSGATAPDIVQLYMNNGFNVASYANFNISTGVVTATNLCTATIDNTGLSTGWWRCTFTITSSVGSTNSSLNIAHVNNNPLATRAPLYVGVVTNNTFIFGAQLEIASSVTTYEPVIFTPILQQGYAQHTRSTTGYKVDSDGRVNEVPQANLIPFSDALNSWSNVNLTVGINALTAPDGTMTADSSTRTGVSNRHQIAVSSYYTLTPIDNYVVSTYVKKDTGTATILSISNQSSFTVLAANFNIATGTVSGTVGCTATMTDEGNGWYRCAIYTGPVALNNFMMNQNGVLSTIGCYLWGMQVTRGTVLQPYYPTVNRANTPRVDYTDGSCPDLLLEQATTNLLVRSEEFDNGSWTKSNITVVPNTDTAPNGLLVANTLTATANDGFIQQNGTFSNLNLIRIPSIYLKRKTGTGDIYLEQGHQNIICNINSSTWTRCTFVCLPLVSTTTIVGGNFTVTTVSPHNLVTGDSVRWVNLGTLSGSGTPNGVTATVTVTSPTQYTFTSGVNTSTNNSQHFVSYLKIRFQTLGDEVYAWGAQLETVATTLQNNYYEPTSYIPTTTATVTRGADILNLYKIRENNLLNNTFSLFWEVRKIGGGASQDYHIGLTDNPGGFASNYFIINGLPLGGRRGDNGVNLTLTSIGNYQPLSTNYYKGLITCNNGIFDVWIDGTKLSTSTMVNYDKLIALSLVTTSSGTFNGISRYKQVLGWNRVLNRSEIDLLFAYPYFNAGYTPTNNELQQIINRAYAEGFTLPSTTILGHCDTLITEMKNDGVWNVSDVYYNFAYNDVTLTDWARINWKNPYGGLGIATLFGGVTYQTNGFKGDGVNGYVDVRFSAQAQAINYQLNNAGRMAVISNIGSGLGNSIDSSTDGERIRLAGSSNQRINSGTGNLNIGITFSGLGLKSIMRDSVTNIRLQDTTILYTRTATSTVLPQNKTLLGSANLDSMFDGAISAYWIGASINNTQINNFRTYYNTYLTNIGLTAFA